jgi:hypothetical protein
VKAIPYAVPIATPEPPPTPEPTPTPEADLIKLAGPMPNTDTPWGVSLAVHDATKEKLNDPDSYKYIGVYKTSLRYLRWETLLVGEGEVSRQERIRRLCGKRSICMDSGISYQKGDYIRCGD